MERLISQYQGLNFVLANNAMARSSDLQKGELPGISRGVFLRLTECRTWEALAQNSSGQCSVKRTGKDIGEDGLDLIGIDEEDCRKCLSTIYKSDVRIGGPWQ